MFTSYYQLILGFSVFRVVRSKITPTTANDTQRANLASSIRHLLLAAATWRELFTLTSIPSRAISS